MYQLVNSEDREENEIGFDQLYFDDEDNRLEMGVDFKDFDQGSYQEEEVSAEEAMKIYNELKYLAENKLEERETEFTRNRPARIDQFISELDNLLDDYHAELYLKDDVFSGIEAVKRAALGPDTATEN